MAEDLEITDVYDDLRPDELESHQPMDEDRSAMPRIAASLVSHTLRNSLPLLVTEGPRWQLYK